MLGLQIQRPVAPTAFSSSSPMRLEVRPPSLRHKPSSALQRLIFWLLAPAPLDAAPPLKRLPAVRAEFMACLEDTWGDEACGLSTRIERSGSLRELWHLRADLFNLVARQHSQCEAEKRVARLNRHFPTRSPRSGFAPFQA